MMKALMVALMVWASGVTGLPVPEEPPELRIVPAEELQRLYYGEGAAARRSGMEVLASYRAGIVYLPEHWDLRQPRDLSILLHELVHHMQDEAGEVYACPQARERVAFEAQKAWLASMGEDLLELLGLDMLAYAFLTRCPQRRWPKQSDLDGPDAQW